MGRKIFPKLKLGHHLKGAISLYYEVVSRLGGFLTSPYKKASHSLKKARRSRTIAAFIVLSVVIAYAGVWLMYCRLSENGPTVVRFPGEGRKEQATTEATPERLKAPVKAGVPRIAIILDDAGAGFLDYEDILSIEGPITLSVLPNLPASAKVVHEARLRGKESMLHLPMEPKDASYVRRDGGMVLVSMDDEEIKTVVTRDLSTVPGVVGVSNHMGSRATTDPRVVSAVLSAVKEKGLFFVDSRTDRNSVAFDIALDEGLRAARNSVFLDAVASEEAISRKLNELVWLSKKWGTAIGIGHATRPETIAALKKLMPVCEKAGVKFVFASSVAGRKYNFQANKER